MPGTQLNWLKQNEEYIDWHTQNSQTLSFFSRHNRTQVLQLHNHYSASVSCSHLQSSYQQASELNRCHVVQRRPPTPGFQPASLAPEERRKAGPHSSTVKSSETHRSRLGRPLTISNHYGEHKALLWSAQPNHTPLPTPTVAVRRPEAGGMGQKKVGCFLHLCCYQRNACSAVNWISFTPMAETKQSMVQSKICHEG